MGILMNCKKKRTNNLIVSFLLFLILLPTFFIGIKEIMSYGIITEENDYKTHLNISVLTTELSIDGNQAWVDIIDEFNFTGYGNSTHPYIIKDLEIDGQDSIFSCISIQNSDVYFQIENCTLYNATHAIYLRNVTNAIISDVKIYDNYYNGIYAESITNLILNNISSFNNERYGIYLRYVMNSTISNSNFSYNQERGLIASNAENLNVSNTSCSNNIYCGISLSASRNSYINNITSSANGYDGISLYYCENCTVLNSILMNNPAIGIDMDSSVNNTLQDNNITDCGEGIYIEQSISSKLIGNEMIGCGVSVFGVSKNIHPSYYYADSMFFDHQIDIENHVNGKRLYYYKNEKNLDGNNFSDAGQVILYNCSNAFIEDLNLSFTSTGLQLISCNLCIVNNVTLNNNTWDGLYMLEGLNIDILNNVANYNGNSGINFEASNYITFFNNTACGNREGIASHIDWLQSNDYNMINNNTLENNSVAGINLYRSSHNIIVFNEIKGNLNGIYMKECHDSYIFENNIDKNVQNGIYLYKSDNNEVFNNRISNNDIGIYLYYSENNKIDNNNFYGNNVEIEIVNENLNAFIIGILILIIIVMIIGLGGSIVAVSYNKFTIGNETKFIKHEKYQKLSEEDQKIKKHEEKKVKSAKEITSELTNKDLLFQMIDSGTDQEINMFSGEIKLSIVFDEFFDLVNELGLNEKDKKEFLKDMYCFKPSERLAIVNEMLLSKSRFNK